MKLATLCYIKNNGKYLMRRKLDKSGLIQGKWNGPGGKFEAGETPEECVIREIREETGLEIENPKLKGIITFANNLRTSEDWYVFVFTVDKYKGEIKPEDGTVLEWFELDEIFDLDINNADKKFLHWIEKDEIFSAKFDDETEESLGFGVNFY